MANKDRGEVALQAGDVTHVIRFTVNSLCNLEDHMDLPITEIATKLGDGKKVRIGLLRTLLKFGLVEEKTIEQVGEIIGEAGLPAVMMAIQQGIAQAFPKPEAKAAEENPK